MYAMLTGCLPFTVEPFNITALHAKMLQNKINPIPDHLSHGEFVLNNKRVIVVANRRTVYDLEV